MKLLPNTYRGLLWGLEQFDGIEFDIRLTKDNKLVIYHDATLENGEYIVDLSLEELDSRGIPTLSTFFGFKRVQKLSASKTMFVELKPNCDGKSRDTSIAQDFFNAFESTVPSEIDKQSIAILSFSKELLLPFVNNYRCFPILPDINECNSSNVMLRALPKFFLRSMSWHLQNASNMGFAGVTFAREYIMGLMSRRHPSLNKMLRQANILGLQLGTNLGDPALEQNHPQLWRFSDKLSDYPRNANQNELGIIAHRGTGTKGIEIPDNEVPPLE